MKLMVTDRNQNLRTGRVEMWRAATPCGTYVAERTEEPGTPWVLLEGREVLAICGTLKSAQRTLDARLARLSREAGK
jgi:hypothetical protein